MNFEQTEKEGLGHGEEQHQDSQFYPEEEIQKIKNAPKSERRDLVDDFKRRLVEHRKGLADIQNRLFRKLKYDPDTPISELFDLVKEKGRECGINEKELQKTKEALKRFARMRSQVRRWREEFPNDKDLYKDLFGREPKGKISVQKDVATLHFLCKNPEDYIWIVERGWSEEDPSEQQKNISKKSKGIKLGAPPKGKYALQDAITAEVVGRGSSDYLVSEFYEKSMAPQGAITGSVHAHERQHTRFQILTGSEGNRSITKEGDLDFPDLMEVIKGSDEEGARDALHDYLQRFLTKPRHRARDEVLAYLSENRDLDQVFRLLTKTKDEGGLYDKRRSSLIDHFARIIPEELEDPSYEELVRGVATEVLISEYNEQVKEALDAVRKLRGLGYAKKDIIAILTFEPLSRWKKFVSRLEEIENN